jgi:4-hydroxy-3-methylbut-2-enyl diphosphate reductase
MASANQTPQPNNLTNTRIMNIHLASHHGMCFGVRDALRAAHAAAKAGPVTLLGPLVHNARANRHLELAGATPVARDAAPATRRVVISAHGASNRERAALRAAGHELIDTTCPLVRKAHDALAMLAAEGWFPVILGQAGHVEVRGLAGDHPECAIIAGAADIDLLPHSDKLGVVAQTTMPLERALGLVAEIKRRRPGSAVRFMDTVCRPTKERQVAVTELAARCEVVVVVGGRDSSNTRQLAARASALGARAHQVEGPDDLDPRWFRGVRVTGVTAGTSALDETVHAVVERLRTF